MIFGAGQDCPIQPLWHSSSKCGVRSKKFEQISPKICRAGGIPPKTPFRPPRLEAEAKRTISSFSLAANSFYS
ncbi:MAG: hypothetical protein COZ87_04410, partial [Candidatus Moranbacteria bacterium CG_4_8_14_3_um_filter_43_15]